MRGLNEILVPAAPEPKSSAPCAAILDVVPCHELPEHYSIREHNWVRDIAAYYLRCTYCKATVSDEDQEGAA